MTERKKIWIWSFNIAALSLFGFLLIWSRTDTKTMRSLFANVSYYLTLLIAVLWIIQLTALLRELGFSIRVFFRNYWPGIVLALGLTIFVFCSVKVGFKTLSDETNLVSVSGSMTRNKTVLNCTMAKYYYGNLQPINQEIEKRPLVFPFLVSIIHTFTGFRYQNAFALNFIVMFLFLAGVYAAARKLLDAWSAVAAVFFVLSYPVFTIFATSAGFDVLNSVFFILILATVFHFVKSPSSPGFGFLLSSLIVFANIRYESVVFLLLIPLLLAFKIKWQYLKDSFHLFCAIPLACLPYLWVRLLKPGAYYESVKDVKLFSFKALATNLSSFFSNLLDFSYTLPYAGLVTLAGILIFLYLLILTLRKKAFVENRQRYFLVVLFISAGLSTLMYFAHFFGRYTHPSSARFFITLSLLFAFSPVILRIASPRLVSGPVLFLLAVVSFVYYHPIAVEGRLINSLTLNRHTGQYINFLKKLDDKNILIISSRPGQNVALGYGAVDFAYANKNKAALLKELDRHLYSKIVVFQEITHDTGKPSIDTTLDPAYRLLPVYEIQTTASAFLRISECTASITGVVDRETEPPVGPAK
ncbi:MAG: glycosyltransferase family 39 protein [Sedimentisphaerales bacterium]|nr:glycosyltransferase family 39 protein [Sedimentisphaerales bacterium]